MRLYFRFAYRSLNRVSTLIRPEGRMRLGAGLRRRGVGAVSTLIRPEGRMRPLDSGNLSISEMFQPSSDPKAGCDQAVTVDGSPSDDVSTLIRPEGRMRPVIASYVSIMAVVSTLIRPEGRMRLEFPEVEGFAQDVSTLIRPEGRMRPNPRLNFTPLLLFQPSSDPKAGCDMFFIFTDSLLWCFNPHPTRRPDAT